jgi:hypothetical protein
MPVNRFNVKCAICGMSWDRSGATPCTHTQAEWDSYEASWGDPTRVASHWLEDPAHPIPPDAPTKDPWPPPPLPGAPIPAVAKK